MVKMETIYAVDLKMNNDGEEFERTLAMDISSMNVLACSCYYLFASSKLKYSPHLVSTPLQQAAKASFCVYVCALEQPWHFCLITTSHVPIVHLVWSLDGTHLLVCNQIGLCRVFKMKNGCINTMENIYQYETNEDIIAAKYLFYKEPVIINLERKDSIFYERDTQSSSPMLQYALQSGNFVCVTSSGTVHSLPLNRSLTPYRYSLSQNEPLSISLCDILATEKGFDLILGERVVGALIHFFVVHYAPLEPKLAYISCRRRGFRIPSCYGKLESLVYFQRSGIDCVLTHMSLPSGDSIDLYEYNLEQEEWISITLLNSPHLRVTSISVSPSVLLVKDNEFQGHFGRQILVSFTDGSMVVVDKLTLKCKEQVYPLSASQVFSSSEYFVRMQHTTSGACALALTQTGCVVLLRTISLDQASSPSMSLVLVHLFEQWMTQDPTPMDLWDILALISNRNYESLFINELIDLFVQHFDEQSIDMKRNYFIRFEQVLFHLHRLASPFTLDSTEHLTSLLTYQLLVLVRDYLRLFIYEPTGRNFVETAQEILQQTLTLHSIDFKRIKYLPEQGPITEPLPCDPRDYQSISFISLINWIADLIFYLVGYLQLQQLPLWLSCKHIFHDYRQLQWLRELVIYANVLQKMNKIPSSKFSFLQSPTTTTTNNADGQAAAPPQKDLLKDIYHSITRLSQKIETQKTVHFDESYLEDFSVLDVELLQSKADGMFPKAYPYLIPNSPLPQTFIRGQAPPFAAHLYGNPITIDLLGGAVTNFSSYSSTLLNDDHLQDTKFDVMTLNKMSLTSNPVFRRCVRCSNFSRIYKNKPYPLLTYRFNHRCICGGLFLLYTRSNMSTNSSMTSNSNVSSNVNETAAAASASNR